MAEAIKDTKKGKSRFLRFFKEVKSEIKKIVWPAKEQVVKNTLIVLAAVVIIGAVIWLLDLLFQYGFFKLI